MSEVSDQSLLGKIRAQINKDDDARINIASYKSQYVTTIVKNCEDKCPKCHKQNVNCITKQVRSADEGATNFYTCLECGYKWKLNN